MNKPPLVVILGPTASGKTGAAIAVAKRFDGEVISADSRTVYRGMDIGTAKPEGKRGQGVRGKGQGMEISDLFKEQPLIVEGVPHWGFDVVRPDEAFTAAEFKAYAEKHIADIAERGKLPILAGGTGLYVSAVVDNLTFSDVEPNLDLRRELDALTDDALRERLVKIDPEAAKTVDVQNRRRLLRAIEIIEGTGKPLASQQTKGAPKFDALMIGMKVDRDTLNERIDARVDAMIAAGLVDEVRGLKEEYGCDVNAMTGIGYRQICAFLNGYIKLRDAIEMLKRDTRQYAKRQMTWFKRDERVRWVEGVEGVEEVVGEWLG